MRFICNPISASIRCVLSAAQPTGGEIIKIIGP
jgi:hypothetical protein